MVASPGVDIVCGLAAGQVEAEVVYRDEGIIAFLDHRPLFKGHVLVCPVKHVETLLELPGEEIAPLFAAVQRVARAVVEALGAQGSFTAINTVVSQSVPHLHVHVVPRTKGDGLRGFFWPRTKYADGEAAQYAERLRAALTTS
ncbi:HIT family protein [Tessaracoccus sp. MC1865]|uniref:HIT family protein n=1 Tax=Tessaracoccus sp. MC1865 TaxID=2760310 RepID=UPI0016027CD1|nr:HIT family protein [Tessaracoccus sp. MC1865]MBB1484453.1 HIT family protein [Tessaracoccus sp. MC1865]QTO38442.1 HIT family protein [Tessaracoccus sp. MC1865]